MTSGRVSGRFSFQFGSADLSDLAYWINERHRIYLKREAGHPWPWTDDPVLRIFKFTNVFRELDKGTLALRKMVQEVEQPALLMFNIVWYRMFNRYEHAENIGVVSNLDALRKKLDIVERQGHRLFTSAHMTVGRAGQAKKDTVLETLADVLDRMEDLLWIGEEGTLESAFKRLLKLRFFGIGKFIAYEIVTDMRWYPQFWPEGEPTDVMSWASIGPGCKRGMHRLGYDDCLENMLRIYQGLILLLESHVTRHHPPLELREVEHSLCEFDKYQRGGSKERYHHGR